MNETAIETNALGKRYRLGEFDGRRLYRSIWEKVFSGARNRHGNAQSSSEESTSDKEIWALKGVSFKVHTGERVGIIGRNGAGKTTLLRVISGITEPTAGEARVRGRVSSLLEVGTGFHGELTGKENIFLNGAILGLRRDEIRRNLDEIIEFSGVEEFIDTPVKRYSSGMSVRLAFAVAAHLRPDILLVDEVLAVGDAEFRRKCLGRMEQASRSGRTVLFVSHNMSTVSQLCERGILLDHGRIVFDGPIRQAIDAYLGTADQTITRLDFPIDSSKPVQITGLSCIDRGTRERAIFSCDEPLTLAIEVLAHETVTGTINVALSTAEGVRLCHSVCANSLGGYSEFMARQRSRFTMTFPGGLLNEGQYQFTVWLVPKGEIGSYDVAASPPINLEMIAGKETIVGERKKRPDVLRLDLPWQMEKA